MTRAQPEASPFTFHLPAGAPGYARALDGVDEAEARRLLADGGRVAIGPVETMDLGVFHASVRSDGPGAPFVVIGCGGDVRGVLASWTAAAALAVAEAMEIDAALAAVCARAVEGMR